MQQWGALIHVDYSALLCELLMFTGQIQNIWSPLRADGCLCVVYLDTTQSRHVCVGIDHDGARLHNSDVYQYPCRDRLPGMISVIYCGEEDAYPLAFLFESSSPVFESMTGRP